MRYNEYRINTFVDQLLYDEWKDHLRKKGHHVFGRDSELTMSTRKCLEYGIRQALKNPKVMKEVMANVKNDTTTCG